MEASLKHGACKQTEVPLLLSVGFRLCGLHDGMSYVNFLKKSLHLERQKHGKAKLVGKGI